MCSWDETVNTKNQSLYMGFSTGLIEQNKEVPRFLSLKFWHKMLLVVTLNQIKKKKRGGYDASVMRHD